MPLWNEIEGRTLDGLPLGTLLRSEGRTAWFATTDTERQPAVLSVFEALNDEDTVEARLRTAAGVRHPNLLTIRGTGVARLDDEPLVYALMEPFEQTLAEVLRDRPLTADEAREVADSLLSALETVEAAGLYHGHVDASGVLAVGDGIKLRSDCLTPRQGQSDAPGLAALVFNALTGRRFANERDAIQLPAPFATFVRAGASNNGSLAAMRRVLSGPATANTPVAPVVAPVAAPIAPVAAAAPVPATPPAVSDLAKQPAKAVPVLGAGIPRAALRKTDDKEERPSRRPGVAIAALVLMALAFAIFWYIFKRPAGHMPISGEAANSATSAPQAAPAAPPTAAPEPSKPSAATESQPAARRPPRTAPAPTASDSATSERSVWHVVAYTYTHEEPAQRKAAELAARYPQLEPQVFTPNGGPPFLVVLGGGTDRQGAFARRDAARAAGMPPDTYAQNFRK